MQYLNYANSTSLKTQDLEWHNKKWKNGDKERWPERWREVFRRRVRERGGRLRTPNCSELRKNQAEVYRSSVTFDLNSQKSCDFEYLFFFLLLASSVSLCFLLLCSGLIWDSEGRAIDRGRRERRERSSRWKQDILNAVETKVALAASSRENYMFTTQRTNHQIIFSLHFIAQACWLNCLAHRHPLTHISRRLKLSHFCLSWLVEKPSSPLFTSLR